MPYCWQRSRSGGILSPASQGPCSSDVTSFSKTDSVSVVFAIGLKSMVRAAVLDLDFLTGRSAIVLSSYHL